METNPVKPIAHFGAFLGKEVPESLFEIWNFIAKELPASARD